MQREETDIAPGDVLDAMENEHDRRILALAQEDPVDAQQIMDETGMAKSTVYRRLHTLKRHGLLAIERSALRDGHPVELYRAQLEALELRIEGGELQIRWRGREDSEAASPMPSGPSVALAGSNDS